ncbi:DUF2782 domain-containing protein [Caldimonas brevitalea]|uniref:DUF2782 domain-containing protein n=1 Tax=Caldimonas brevitalea TaxID=413882 RepID=A0A0G3BRC8_9BURK|nr:DUF2782 domain-containing protein [Caldimonas brevitalea]AKJ30543.1 hypothetical protein AAW51_3852 [Caldimonas brevitalea]
MKPTACRLAPLAVLLAAVVTSPASAQTTAAPAGGEPAVQRTRIEDDNARIDELRVRGQNQSIKVQPKKGGAAYEVLPADGSRDLSGDGTRGAAGQRVWHLLSF